jgi:hypothetical protein
VGKGGEVMCGVFARTIESQCSDTQKSKDYQITRENKRERNINRRRGRGMRTGIPLTLSDMVM